MTVTFDTVEPADSVEFCPHPRAQDVFVCGTYKLLEADVGDNAPAQAQCRRGKCLVLTLRDIDGVVGM
jgi:diphthine methyl ester acylhydrolase